MKTLTLLITLLFLSYESKAVNISPSGQGEFLLVPYYNITNGYNATVNVYNHDDKGKAVKIHIRESLAGHSVLSYNVYLAPKDSWAFALGPKTTTAIGWQNQQSGTQVTFDQSCSPGLNKSDHEFSGENFSAPHEPTRNMSRTKEGFIEIIEMATIDPESAIHHQLLADASGTPAGCQSIDQLWQTDGDWQINEGQSHLLPPTGTLSVNASLINVPEGIEFPIESTVFSNFFEDGVIMHTPPSSNEPTINAGMNTATLINEGQILNLEFETGIDAISGLLMKFRTAFQSNMEPDLAAATEVGITFPTRRFYFNEANYMNAPFNGSTGATADNCGTSQGGSEFYPSSIDRDGRLPAPGTGIITQPPQPPAPLICGSTATLIVKSHFNPINAIFSSRNAQIVEIAPVQYATDSGHFNLYFANKRFSAINLDTHQTVEFSGTPVVGTSFQKATNAYAAPGLLAQYGYSTPLITYDQSRIE